MCMFLDESLETTPPSRRTHPIPELNQSIGHDVRVKLSPSIWWENPSSRKAKSCRKGCAKKRGHSRRCRLQEPREWRKNLFDNKRLVCLSLLPIRASHKRDGGRLELILG